MTDKMAAYRKRVMRKVWEQRNNDKAAPREQGSSMGQYARSVGFDGIKAPEAKTPDGKGTTVKKASRKAPAKPKTPRKDKKPKVK